MGLKAALAGSKTEVESVLDTERISARYREVPKSEKGKRKKLIKAT